MKSWRARALVFNDETTRLESAVAPVLLKCVASEGRGKQHALNCIDPPLRQASPVQEGGFLGYMQSTGDDPSDGQPLSATKVPNFED